MQAREKRLKQFVLLRKLKHGNAALRLCTWRRCVFFASVDATLDQEAGNNRNRCPFRLRIYQKIEQTSRPAAETRCDPSSGASSSSAGTQRANRSYRKKPWARVGCHLALEEKVTALICLGYPLCGGGDPAKLRAEVLRALTTPILFVQGTRDRLCPLQLLESVRQEMRAINKLHIVQGGDHSLLVTQTQLKVCREIQDDVDERILEAIRSFLEKSL